MLAGHTESRRAGRAKSFNNKNKASGKRIPGNLASRGPQTENASVEKPSFRQKQRKTDYFNLK
jgi:hypothetical protein